MDTQRKPGTTGSTQQHENPQQHETLGDKATDAVASAREQGRQAVEQGKQKASEMAGQAQQQATSMLDERKTDAVHRLEGVAGALRQTSHELQSQEEETIARYTEAAADQVERFSHYLQDRNFGQLMGEAKQMARRQPELFVAGALALGFLAGRFLKSSGAMSGGGEYGYRSDPYAQADWYERYGRFERYEQDAYDRGYYGDYSPSTYVQGGYNQGGYGQSSYSQGAGQGYIDRGNWDERDQGPGGVYGSRPYSGGYNQGSAYGSGSAYSQSRGYGSSSHAAYGGSEQSGSVQHTDPDSRHSEFRSQSSGSSFDDASMDKPSTGDTGDTGMTQSGGNYSSTGVQSAGSSAQQGQRTPADPTGSSSDLDTGRSNPSNEEGRQGNSSSARQGDNQSQEGKGKKE